MARATLPQAKKTAPKGSSDEPKKAEKPKETTSEFIASIAVVLVTGLFIITFTLQAFEIPSSSMENTLLIGDHVFVDRMIFAPVSKWIGPLVHYRDPQHGDIMVFISPGQPGLFVVKRVMGVPGDRIQLKDGVVYRNGEKLNEPYVVRCNDQPGNAGMCLAYDDYRDNFPNGRPDREAMCEGCTEWRLTMQDYVKNGELVVPPGRIFAMGDNRDVSLDSRYWGFVPRENVVGRPMFIYWSFETPRGEYLRTSIGDRISSLFNIVIHFFDRTRWSRMLHVVH